MKRLLAIALSFLMLAGLFVNTFAVNSDDLDRLRETNECSKCDLVGADLRGADLSEANLTRTNLKGANLTAVNLEAVNLKETKFYTPRCPMEQRTARDASFWRWNSKNSRRLLYPVVAKNRTSMTSFHYSFDSWAMLRIYENNRYNLYSKDAQER